MNVNKEFVSMGENVTVSVSAINNAKTGKQKLTVYANNAPVGSTEINLEYLEQKTVEIPIVLKSNGLNKITISSAPQLFRNVFVQEEQGITNNIVIEKIKGNSLKVSILIVFLLFAGMLYYVRNKLKEETPIEAHDHGIMNKHAENNTSDLKNKLNRKMDDLTSKMKDIMKKKGK